jgi:hypothetical protein
MNADELIALSREEDRTVTSYPAVDEYEDLVGDLFARCKESHGVDYPESGGIDRFWGLDWRVDVMRPC